MLLVPQLVLAPSQGPVRFAADPEPDLSGFALRGEHDEVFPVVPGDGALDEATRGIVGQRLVAAGHYQHAALLSDILERDLAACGLDCERAVNVVPPQILDEERLVVSPPE